jgi:hypothetical protein
MVALRRWPRWSVAIIEGKIQGGQDVFVIN